jgi:hypothetical protein
MKKINYLLLLFSLFLFSCSGFTDKENDKKQQTVSIYDGVPVKETPSKEGQWVSKLNLGETLYFLGEEVVDSSDNNREYFKVELSDGKIAWAMSYGLIVNAKIAAIKENVPVYERPDLVTLTKNVFNTMDVVAIEEIKDGWIKVVGENKKIKGWINQSVVTENKEDVAVAILATKQLMKNGKIIPEKIDGFLMNLPYKNSFFIGYIKALVANEEPVEEPEFEETSNEVDVEESVEESQIEETGDEIETDEALEK